MQVQLIDSDPGSLEDMVGPDCYEAALGYVRRQAVLKQVWAGARNELWGLVQGRHGECYAPVVYFSRQDSVLEVRGTRCSCDAGNGCEHAAALLISAVEGGGAAGPGGPAGPRQAPRPPTWDTSLESLLVRPHWPAS
jgi:SWIM zinc finger